MKVIIIGSGLSGLTAGAYLSREGYEVIIYEQFSKIGGVTATISQKGYMWDLGPLLLEGFAPHEKFGKVLSELGLTDKITLINEDRGQSFPDFQIWKPEKYEGPYWRKNFIKKIFPSESDGLDRYYNFHDRMMSLLAISNQLEWANGFKSIWLKLKIIPKFLKVKKMLKWNAAQVMDSFFKDPKLKAVYFGILADFVVKPSEFIGLGVPVVNIETAFDKRIDLNIKGGKLPTYHYIKGGCGQLIQALANFITAHKGKIVTETLVEKIIIENNRVKGIKLKDDEFKSADLVLASGSAQKTFLDLVGTEYLSSDYIEHVKNLVRMQSVLMVHIGIDFDPTPYQRAALCYYYLTYDIEEGVNRCRSGDYHEGKDGFLIYIPSLHSPEMAPDGKYAITVYTIAPDNLKEGSWVDRKEELGEKLLIEAEKIIPGLRERAQTKIILTPDDFKSRINVNHHSFGGLAPIIGQQGPSHRTPIRGLYFIGSQSESGGGVSGVVIGARKTIQMILKGK